MISTYYGNYSVTCDCVRTFLMMQFWLLLYQIFVNFIWQMVWVCAVCSACECDCDCAIHRYIALCVENVMLFMIFFPSSLWLLFVFYILLYCHADLHCTLHTFSNVFQCVFSVWYTFIFRSLSFFLCIFMSRPMNVISKRRHIQYQRWLLSIPCPTRSCKVQITER